LDATGAIQTAGITKTTNAATAVTNAAAAGRNDTANAEATGRNDTANAEATGRTDAKRHFIKTIMPYVP
jgi:hypothetical protein